jgi:CBS domain-containing protein
MLLKEIMTPEVEVVAPETTIWEAADVMRRLNVGSLPVSDGTKIVGIITDRDITVRATAEGYDPHATRVGQCMSTDIHYCMEDDETAAAEALMQEKQIRRVPVFNRDNELVGMVALADLVTKTAETDEVERTLWNISRPDGGNGDH